MVGHSPERVPGPAQPQQGPPELLSGGNQKGNVIEPCGTGTHWPPRDAGLFHQHQKTWLFLRCRGVVAGLWSQNKRATQFALNWESQNIPIEAEGSLEIGHPEPDPTYVSVRGQTAGGMRALSGSRRRVHGLDKTPPALFTQPFRNLEYLPGSTGHASGESKRTAIGCVR